MSLTAHCHCQAFVLGSRPSGPRRPPCHPQGTLPDPSLSYGHHDVKAKKEIVLQRGVAPGRPVGRPASPRRAAAWRPQTGRPTGRAAAPRPGRCARDGVARSVAVHRADPSAGPPQAPHDAPRHGVSRRACRRAGLLRPGRCARDGAARPGALPRHEILLSPLILCVWCTYFSVFLVALNFQL
jgi:hypothetical protein